MDFKTPPVDWNTCEKLSTTTPVNKLRKMYWDKKWSIRRETRPCGHALTMLSRFHAMNNANAQAVLPQSVGKTPSETCVHRGYDRALQKSVSIVEMMPKRTPY